jgi:hypothetical protein
LLLLPVPEAALLVDTATARPSPARDESDDASCRDGDVPIVSSSCLSLLPETPLRTVR